MLPLVLFIGSSILVLVSSNLPLRSALFVKTALFVLNIL